MGRTAVGGGIGVLVLALVMAFMGVDPQALLKQAQPLGGNPQAEHRQVDPAEQPLKEFVSVVLADTEDVWRVLFRKHVGQPYREPKLVLFSGQVKTGAGVADAAMGPFYLPS